MLSYQDRDQTLNLFENKADASREGQAEPYAYGWIAKQEDGRWRDASGTLPARWSPQQKLEPTPDMLKQLVMAMYQSALDDGIDPADVAGEPKLALRRLVSQFLGSESTFRKSLANDEADKAMTATPASLLRVPITRNDKAMSMVDFIRTDLFKPTVEAMFTAAWRRLTDIFHGAKQEVFDAALRDKESVATALWGSTLEHYAKMTSMMQLYVRPRSKVTAFDAQLFQQEKAMSQPDSETIREERRTGTVVLTVSALETEDDRVHTVGWKALLHRNASEGVSAAAGWIISDQSGTMSTARDWIFAADELGDDCMVQMHAFCNEHTGEQIISGGSAVFVSEWKNNLRYANKGDGAALLSSALRLLGDSYQVKAVAFDMRLPQYMDWAVQNEPDIVAFLKRKEQESLWRYISTRKIGIKGARNFMITPTIDEDDEDAVLHEIGRIQLGMNQVNAIMRKAAAE